MPYIILKHRTRLDPHIDALANAIIAIALEEKGGEIFAGLLNYACTRLAIKTAFDLFGKIRYWIIASLSGLFANISQEFYRRVAGPYEDKQSEKSGDVKEFSDFEKQL
jgi:hypothetical protein